MPEQEPTRTMTISEVKRTLSRTVTEVFDTKTRIIVEKSGIPVAALVSVEDLERLQQFDRDWEEGTKAIERFSRAFADVPTDEAEAEIARIIAEIRQQDVAEAERRSA